MQMPQAVLLPAEMAFGVFPPGGQLRSLESSEEWSKRQQAGVTNPQRTDKPLGAARQNYPPSPSKHFPKSQSHIYI